MDWTNEVTADVSELMSKSRSLKREVKEMISNNRHYRRVQDASWEQFLEAVAQELEPLVTNWVRKKADDEPLAGLALFALESVDWEQLATAWIE